MRDRVVNRLLGELESPDTQTRAQAIWQLSYRRLYRSRMTRRRRDAILAALTRVAHQDGEPSVRAAAVHTFMWHFGSVNPTSWLLERAEHDDDPNVRGQALESLAVRWANARRSHAGRTRIADLLARTLEDASPVVRFWSVYAVGCLRIESLREAVERRVQDTGLGFGTRTVGEEAAMWLETNQDE